MTEAVAPIYKVCVAETGFDAPVPILQVNVKFPATCVPLNEIVATKEVEAGSALFSGFNVTVTPAGAETHANARVELDWLALHVPDTLVATPAFMAFTPLVHAHVGVAAFAIGSGPTTPNKSDPTSTSNVEVLAVPEEEEEEEVGCERLDIRDFLRNNFKLIFEAPTFDFRARIKDNTRE